jgi:hypothetical protein
VRKHEALFAKKSDEEKEYLFLSEVWIQIVIKMERKQGVL